MTWTKTAADRKRDAAVYGSDWRKLRVRVLLRDNRRCVLCGSTMKLTVDHITPVSQGGTDQMVNLRTLCEGCHQRKTSMEGHTTRSNTTDPAPKPATIW